INEAVAAAVDTFGGIDVCVNNASVLSLAGTLDLAPRRYDLMQDVNTRGTFMLTRACLPYLLAAVNPHVLTLSPAAQPEATVARGTPRLHARKVRNDAGHARDC